MVGNHDGDILNEQLQAGPPLQTYSGLGRELGTPTPKAQAILGQPAFEDFRAPDTPPPVFRSAPEPQEDVITEPTMRKKRPRAGPRGVSFSKSILGLGKEAQKAAAADGTMSSDDYTWRGNMETSNRSTGAQSASKQSEDQSYSSVPKVEITALDHAELKKTLTRSSTTSSVEDWLGVKKSKSDMRLSALAEQKEPKGRGRSHSSGPGSLSRISSFKTESEFRAAEKWAVTVGQSSIPDTISESTTPTPDVQSAGKKLRPGFMRTRSRKSMASLPATPSSQSVDTPDPMQGTEVVREMSPLRSPKSPKSPKSPSKGYGGFLWQPKQRGSMDDVPSPTLAKSRRTGTFDEAVAPPSQAPARPLGVPEFRVLDMHPLDSPVKRYPSSDVSPGDTSLEGLNHHLTDSFEEAIRKSEEVKKEMNLRPPSQRFKHGRTAARSKSHDYLPSEATRINTPPVIKPGKGNRLMGQFWDMAPTGIDHPSPATSNTPSFPMPRELVAHPGEMASMPGTSMLKTGRASDWYRVRADAVLDEDDEDMSTDEVKAMIDWSIPEHLSNSPLCPANPKHYKGGTGICMYHGRAGRRNMATEKVVPF